MNGGHLGFMFTAKDLASGAFARQNKNVQSLAANSEAAAGIYERSMARMRKGAMMLGIAIVGLLGMAKVTKTFGEFQYTLASAGAVMHATAGEMKVLERAAIDAGIATQFSPKEAAEGLQSLGAAGLNVKQAVEVLNPVLDLAAASMGQLGVAGAAENVVGVLNAFSMQADKAGMVADKLTRISQLTNFQFRDFSVAISQAAAQASTADQSFESMLATLGMLRNTNLTASSAATAYREAVRRLSGDKRAHKELTKLHVEVLNKETGKIRDLGAIMADLAPRLEKMNSKEKNLLATRIFGVRGMKTYAAFVAQYNKLVKEGTVMTGDYAGAHARLVSELKNSEGAAAKNRDALLSTAEGQRKLLKGSWETTQIMLGKLALPAVLPALKAFTDVLNVVIKLIDAIPGPLRSMMANFLGVGLAIKGVVGAFTMLRGVAGIAMMGRMAAGATAVASSTATAAQNTGRLAAATQKLRSGFGRFTSAVGRSLPIIGTVVAALFALHSYEKQKEKEEDDRWRRKQAQWQKAQDSYKAAIELVRKFRAAEAKATEAELQGAKGSYAKAMLLVDKYAAKHSELTTRIEEARKQYLAANAVAVKGEPSYDRMLKARDKYIQISGKQIIVNKALVAAEAEAARQRIRSARGDKAQVLATRILVDRYNKQEAMEKKLHDTGLVRRKQISLATGKDKVARERAWSVEKKNALRVIANYQNESAAMALKYKLGKRDMLQNKERQKDALRAIAAPRMKALEGVAPGEEFMKRREGWRGPLSRGFLPKMKAADVPEFMRYLQIAGPELEISKTKMEQLRRQAIAGQAAGPEATFGGEPTVTPRVHFASQPAGGAGPSGLAPAVSTIADLQGRLIQELRAQARREGRPIMVNLNVDGSKLASIIARENSRGDRQQDGTGGEGQTASGAG